jgi:hypothetical protein
MGDLRNPCKILVRKPEKKRLLDGRIIVQLT